MSWRDNLKDASFRGIPFKVENHTVAGGRRIKRTDRWQKRTITTDMGPELVEFHVVGYIVQSTENNFDYMHDRDRLLDVLQNNTDNDKFNIGTLVHPFFGKRRVHPEKYNFSESFSEGGIARFDITFLLEEDELFPGMITAPAAKIDAIAVQVNNINLDTFIALMDDAQSFVEDLGQAATAMLSKVSQAVNSINGVIRSAVATALGVISTALSTIGNVLNAPCDFIKTITGAIDSFQNVCGMAGEVFTSGIVGGCSGSSYGGETVLDGTVIPQELGSSIIDQIINAQDVNDSDFNNTSPEQTENIKHTINAFKVSSLTLGCRIFARIDFDSKQKLLNKLYELLAAMDALLDRLGEQTQYDNASLFQAVQNLRSETSTLMFNSVENLTSEITYISPLIGANTLVMAYNLYEDVSRCSEVYSRNKDVIIHPGLVPGNISLSVLEK